jgi:hypothetical protein
MKEKYLKYAGELSAIGDAIKKVSNELPVFDEEQEKTFQLEKLNIASEKFRVILDELINLDVPDILVKEHEHLSNGVKSFVLGTSLMKDSINVEEQTVNKKQLMQGDAIKSIGVKAVQDASKDIGDKLVKILNG